MERDHAGVFIEIRQAVGLRRDRRRPCALRRSCRARLRRRPGYSGLPGRPCPIPAPARRSRPGAPLESACSAAAVRSRAVAAKWSWSGCSRCRPPPTIVSWSARARMGAATRRNWRLTAYALCASPLPGYGILPSTSGSPSSNSPQSTIYFCLGQPEVGLNGRVDGGAGQQLHWTNLNVTPTTWISRDRRAGGCQRLRRRLDCERVRRLRQRPGQLYPSGRHHPAELGEQVRHRQLPRGHPGPQRRWSVDAHELRPGQSQPRHRQGRDRPRAPQRHGEGRRGRDRHRRQLSSRHSRSARHSCSRLAGGWGPPWGWRPPRRSMPRCSSAPREGRRQVATSLRQDLLDAGDRLVDRLLRRDAVGGDAVDGLRPDGLVECLIVPPRLTRSHKARPTG